MASKDRRKVARCPGARRRAREIALAALYRGDLLGLDDAAIMDSLPDLMALSIEDWTPKDRAAKGLREEAMAYAQQIVSGVCRDKSDIDQVIQGLAAGWDIDRLALTDRTVLRIAIWELNEATVPPAVVVNEAVELARQYGGTESARFVNGILGTRLAAK